MDHYILGIESSCDDTSAAISHNRKILANVTANQQIHAEYGGVVPELASRAHQQNIVPVVDRALKIAGISPSGLSAIAFTSGPGLLGSLLVGTSFAKSMALALDVPLIEVNHMQAHVLAHLIEKSGQKTPSFPFLCLTVSGGHTQIVKVSAPHQMEIVGETQDDAAGEAFDKAAKIMGLPYPGGPLIDAHARQGDPHKFRFAKPRVPDFNFSFSGLKTNFLYFLQAEVKKDPEFIQKNLADLCAGLQQTILEVLFEKLHRASEKYNIRQIAVAGGVSANSQLRAQLEQREKSHDWEVYIPPFEYCTDNGAMIAITGYYKFMANDFAPLDFHASARKQLSLT